MNKTKLIAYSIAVVAATTSLVAANPNLLTVNPSFESVFPPASGFTSDYTINTVTLGAPETYSVGTPGDLLHSAWNPTLAQDGNQFMMLNGSQDATKNVWQYASPVGVIAGVEYLFEGWLTALHPLNTAEIRFEVSTDAGANWSTIGTSAPLAPQNDDTLPSVWQKSTFSFFAGANGNALLRLQNNQTAFGGNDFGIDNLSFSVAVPEAQTVAAAVGLAGVAGLTILRRRRQA